MFKKRTKQVIKINSLHSQRNSNLQNDINKEVPIISIPISKNTVESIESIKVNENLTHTLNEIKTSDISSVEKLPLELLSNEPSLNNKIDTHKKYLFLFYGENNNLIENKSKKTTNVLVCWENLKKTLIEDTLNQGYETDVGFITYSSEIDNDIKDIIKPKYYLVNERKNKYDTIKEVSLFIKDHKEEYDRIFILRCDIAYKYHLSKWPKLNERSIFFICKDMSWKKTKFCMELLIIVDKEYIDIFCEAINALNGSPIHALGAYLYNNNLPHTYLYDDYYHGHINNELISWLIYEDLPDLDNPVKGEKLKI